MWLCCCVVFEGDERGLRLATRTETERDSWIEHRHIGVRMWLCCCVVFEGDERGLRLATRTETERDSWIEHLHIAGFECLRIQLESLREQLKARTGRDPIESGGLAVDGVTTDDPTSGV